MKVTKFSIAGVIFSLILVSCTAVASKNKVINTELKNVLHNTNNQSLAERVVFDDSSLITITSLSKPNDYPSSFEDTSICINWTLSKESLPHILKSFEKISAAEWQYSYDHLPCAYQGELLYSGITYPFSVNGGAWLSIAYPDSVIRYGCRDTVCADYFLSSPTE